MAAAEIGANFSSYQGNAALGGLDAGVIKIDPTPIQDLTKYSVMYNKSVWEQKQKDADDLIKELSKSSELDLNQLIPEEKNQVLAKWDELNKEGARIAKEMKSGSLDKTEATLQWKEKLKKTADFVSVANTRYLSKAAREKQIAEEKNPEMKAYLQRKLDEALKSTTVEQPIPSLQSYDLTIADKPTPKSITVPVYRFGDDSNFIDGKDYTLVDQKDVNAQAAQMALGLSKLKIDVNSPEFLAKPEKDRKIILEQQEAQTASGKLAEVAASEHYNAALKEYFVDGKLDLDKLKSKNSVLAGVIGTMDAYNAQMLSMQERIRSGEFTDSNGVTHLDIKDYQPISYLDGDISAEDLLKPQIRAKAGAEKMEAKITPTDNKIQNDKNKQDLKIAEMKEVGENNRARLKEKGENYRANLRETGENARAAAKAANGGTTNEGGEFGNLLYGVSSPNLAHITRHDGTKQDLAIKNGVTVDRNGNPVNFDGDMKVPISYFDNSIVTEFNKYVNTGKSDGAEDGKGQKLKVDGDHLVAKFENGIIKGVYADDGTLVSDNQFAHITQVAGQAGVTKYKKADTGYGKADKGGYIETRVVNGVTWGKKADGTIEQVK